MKKGFTLIELLIVIAIIAIIAGAVLVAVNPVKRLGQANNSTRWAEVNSILSAVNQYIVDNQGIEPLCDDVVDFAIPSPGPTALGTTAANCDLTLALVGGGYLSSIPDDPTATGAPGDTGYTISKTATGSFCINAPSVYDDGTSPVITVCR